MRLVPEMRQRRGRARCQLKSFFGFDPFQLFENVFHFEFLGPQGMFVRSARSLRSTGWIQSQFGFASSEDIIHPKGAAMTIELSPEPEQLVEEQVKAGRFTSPSAAVNEAVELMLGEGYEKKRAELLALIDEGLADLDAGRVVEFTADEVIAECRKRKASAAMRGS